MTAPVFFRFELPPFCQAINDSALSVVFKKAKAKTGVMVMTDEGPKFYPENEVPENLKDGELIPGRCLSYKTFFFFVTNGDANKLDCLSLQ